MNITVQLNGLHANGSALFLLAKEDIVWVLEKYRWLPTQEVGEFPDRAFGPECHTNDALSVALETLYEVWTRPLLQSTKQLISDLMLHSVTIGRNSGQVLTLFQIMNNRKSLIWTPAMAQLQSLLRSWTVRRRPVNSAPGPTTDRRSRRRSGLSIALPASGHVHALLALDSVHSGAGDVGNKQHDFRPRPGAAEQREELALIQLGNMYGKVSAPKRTRSVP